LQEDNSEFILAQEQGTIMRRAGAKKELESEFGAGGETEGTLVLTNRRLMFVTTDEREEDLPEPSLLNPFEKERVFFSEVEDIDSIPHDPRNLFIQLESITSAAGRNPELERPHLQIAWTSGEGSKTSLFIETLTGRSRKKNLNDWAAVIERLKAGTQKLVRLPKAPGAETLEGRVLLVMGDMQERGPFAIKAAIEDALKVEVEEDDVESACDRLVTAGLLLSGSDSSGETFYHKASPLGTDDLSV
jgi:hypothetical protein